MVGHGPHGDMETLFVDIRVVQEDPLDNETSDQPPDGIEI